MIEGSCQNLMVQDVHKNMLHAGPETVLSALRQKVWLTQGRREVKSFTRRCVACQRQRVGPCAQKMGQLPEERVLYSPALCHLFLTDRRCRYSCLQRFQQ